MMGELLRAKGYTIKHQIGKGGFSTVFKAVDRAEMDVAIKVVKDSYTAANEKKNLEKIKKLKGVPKILDFIESPSESCIVMNFFPQTLTERFCNLKNDRKMKALAKFARNGLKILQRIHKKGIVHNDIKPSQFMYSSKPKKLFLLDYGLAKSYIKDNKHKKIKQLSQTIGSSVYASINCHKGLSLSRRDDLVSFSYTLITLAKGSLPWENFLVDNPYYRWTVTKKLKSSMTSQEICSGLPSEYSRILDYSKSLAFEDTPNYKYLIEMFKSQKLFTLFSFVPTPSNKTLDFPDLKRNSKSLKFENSSCESLENTEVGDLPEISDRRILKII
jgi:casein kinase 1, delta